MNAKQLYAVAAAGVIALSLAACGGSGAGTTSTSAAPATTGADTAAGGLIGVAMPTETSSRWIADGKAVKSGLEGLGY